MSHPDDRIVKINKVVQSQLRQKNLGECTPIEASRWLEAADLLRPDRGRPGRPLRVLLRKGLIKGSKKGRGGRWVIGRVRP